MDHPSDATTAPRKRSVLITGAAGGLGRCLVAAFAEKGWHVGAGFHRAPLGLAHPLVTDIPCDVTRTDSIEAAVAELSRTSGRIDVLINNAGVTADAPIWEMTVEEWQATMRVNIDGVFKCCRAVVPQMIKQRAGHIVNIGSFSGRVGARGQSNYAASKAAIIGLTQSLARELGKRNICVNAVLPGVLPTQMTSSLPAEVQASLVAANALQRLNDPNEVARFIEFVCGMANISGQIFQLDSRIAR
jgi:3-oxoacyl-[acyl-carrier protein] reductase